MIKVSNVFHSIANSKIMQNHLDKIINDDTLAARVLVCSGVAKDAISYAFRYDKTKKNKEIPEEKRNFVAAMDLTSGISTSIIQLALGFSISNRKLQKALCNKLFGYIKNVEKFGKAKEGFILLLSLITSGVIGERILVPMISTPIASKLKDDWEKKHPQKTAKET